MEWNAAQQGALNDVRAWLDNGTADKQVFRLFGYAGTGKTTLARHLAEGAGRVRFGAFTGKAAFVLRQKGCASAQTIHQMIYRPRDKSALRLKELETRLLWVMSDPETRTPEPPTGMLDDLPSTGKELEHEIRLEKKNLKRPSFTLDLNSEVRWCDLVVIDEVSMVGEEMGADLCSFKKPILVLGDPAQLPPVAAGGYFTGAKPDVMLKEIHRQAAGSPIIQMATRVRQGKGLPLGDYGEDCTVVPKGSLNIEALAAADQVLCGRNNTRRVINRLMREHLGYKNHLPEPGDKLVCLRNNHELALLNGSVWEVLDSEEMSEDEVGLTVQDQNDDQMVVNTVAHRHHFEDRELQWYEKKQADEFDYGYALTVHKSQGSQWDDVVVVNEASCFKEHAKRWLYTGVTRAAKKVTVINT